MSCGCPHRSAIRPGSTTACASRSTTACPSCCRTVGTAKRPCDLVTRERGSYTLAATTFLQDLTEAAARNHARVESLRCFGCGGAPVPPELVDAAGAVGIGVLRLYGSTEVLVGTWNRPSSTADQRRLTDGVAMSHVEVEIRDDDGAPTDRNTPGELYVRGPNTCVGFFDDLERTAATFARRMGSLRRPVHGRRGRLPHGGRSQEGDHHPRRPQHRPPRDRGPARRVRRGGAGRRGRPCPTPVSASACAPVWSCGRGRPSTWRRPSQRLRASGLATYKLPERLEVLDRLPSTASGKIQKHEIVQALGAQP